MSSLIEQLRNLGVPFDPDQEPEIVDLIRKENDILELKKVALEFNGDSDVVELVNKRIIELIPNDLNAYISISWALWLQGNDEEARVYLGKSTELEKRARIDLFTLAACLEQKKHAKMDYYKQILKLDPKDKTALDQLRHLEKDQS